MRVLSSQKRIVLETTRYSCSAKFFDRCDTHMQRFFSNRLLCALLCILSGALTCFGQNAIQLENSLPGNPSSQWDVDGAGDPTIQGFATDISVNVGQTISFKIKPMRQIHNRYLSFGLLRWFGRPKILRQPSAKLPQSHRRVSPMLLRSSIDCGNWAISATWQFPQRRISGIYFAHLIRTDTGGDSHIVFVVRNDSSHSAMLFQTSDETWQAYNDYGTGSLYGPDGKSDLTNRA